MYMVAYAINPDVRAFCIVDEFSYVGMHTFEIGIKDRWARCLDMEDDVQIDFAK